MIDRGLLRDKYLNPNDFIGSFYDELVPQKTDIKKIDIKDLENDALILEYKNQDFFENEKRYSELSREMFKRNLL